MRRVIFILTALFLVFSASCAQAYWLWTPKTGKWVNPKTIGKSSPGEQFEFAKGLYDAKNYQDAKSEFKRLLKFFPKSKEAADGQYYLGLIDENEGNLYEAYLSFQKVIDKYPFSEKIAEITEQQYKIGESFMTGEKRKALGLSLPVENPAIEIFTKVVENSTYGPLAPKAQYKLGLVLKSLTRYYEAEEAFNKVVSNYPDSEWAQAAKFQIASCRASLSRSPDYDQGATQEAKNKFEEFVKNNPDAVLSRDAEKSISRLKEKEAQGSFNIARFYEKQKAFDAARVYYNETISNYPDSIWSARAIERMQVLEKK
jgi:outer membrane protein assembly factor BamD